MLNTLYFVYTNFQFVLASKVYDNTSIQLFLKNNNNILLYLKQFKVWKVYFLLNVEQNIKWLATFSNEIFLRNAFVWENTK